MKKIIYLPLDERPCNYNFPQFLFNTSQYEIIVPPIHMMGDKKKPANFDMIKNFLLESCHDAYGMVISTDTLLYGGIVPSRLHQSSQETLNERLALLKEIKSINPSLVLYAFSLIMRTPQYSSDDEEPSYYQDCGLEIFKRGEVEHKMSLGIATIEEMEALEGYRLKTKDVIDDYLNRRRMNTSMNIEIINQINQTIDYLVIPQDDSSRFGYVKLDQETIHEHISKNNKKVSVYPGADEVGMVLISRMINHDKQVTPKIYVEYSSEAGPDIIPLYEDRKSSLTVSAQINVSGAVEVSNFEDADLVLMINSATPTMDNPNMTKTEIDYSTKRDLKAFVDKIDAYQKTKKVSVADVSIVNGGEIEFVKLLEAKGLIYKLAGYSGWNTFSNTLGTSVAELIYSYHFGIDDNLKRFNALRIFEDIGYCAYVRKDVCDNFLPDLGLNYFDSGDKQGVVSQRVEQGILDIISKISPKTYENYTIEKCYMPWSRMFEVGLKIKENKEKENVS